MPTAAAPSPSAPCSTSSGADDDTASGPQSGLTAGRDHRRPGPRRLEMGNRGRLHQGRDTRDIVRNHQDKAWITCVLSFRGRRVAQWEPNHYTVLFFLDEAVALAAGHRPCAECRRGAYNTYRTLWAETHGGALPYAKEVTSPTAGSRRLLFTPLGREGPVQPVGCCERRVRPPVRDARIAGIRTPLG